MKTLSVFLENFDKNPGNDIKLGVTNHLTPLNNIITNVRNLFGYKFPLIVEPGEDGVSLKIHSSKFTSEDEVYKILNAGYLGNNNLSQYIFSQGLNNLKILNLGSYYVAYFGPTDIATSDPVSCEPCTCTPCACTEMLRYNIDECEMSSINESIIDDEELEDKTKEQLLKFIDGTDKVKCANKLAELLADDLELPSDYYFKGVKDTEGNESIALRYKYTKRRPFGKEIELSKSLLNIYKSGKDAVWVEAFLTKDYNSDEMNKIVDTVLKLIGATPTDDPCVWAIEPSTIQDLKDDVKDNKDKEEENDKDDDLNKKSDYGDEITPNLKNSEKQLKN